MFTSAFPALVLSSIPLFAAQLLDFVWTGAVCDNSAIVVAAVKDHRTTNGTMNVEVKAFANPALTGAADCAWCGDAASGNHYVAKAALTGLNASTKYYYGVWVDGELDDTLNDADNGTDTYTGTFRTFPNDGLASAFMFTFSCSGKPDSECHSIWDTLKSHDALFFIHTGDLYYSDQGGLGYGSEDDFRDNYDRKLNCLPGYDGAREASYFRKIPLAYMWDDHDFGADDSVGTSGPGAISKNYVHPVYRQYVPHYPLAGSGTTGIYQKFMVGRVLFIMTDLRTDAQTPGFNNTRMGTEQKQWFKEQLLRANGVCPVIVWLTTVPWTGAPTPGNDRWQSYTNERAEISSFLKDNNIQGFCALGGDTHCSAIDDGTNTDFADGGGAAFPLFHAGPIGSHTSVKGGPYSLGATTSPHLFGIMAVTDNNDCVEITWSARTLDDIVATNESAGAGYPEIGSKIQYSFCFSNPVLTALLPADDSIDVPLDTSLMLSFNKDIRANYGAAVVTEVSNGIIHAVIDVNSDSVSVSSNTVTIHMPTDLAPLTEYFVTVDTTALADNSGNCFAGITAPGGMEYHKWNFTADVPEPGVMSAASLAIIIPIIAATRKRY